jgi:universal stress protein A
MSTNPLLVAVDFSGPSDRALTEAVALARALSVPLELVHVHQMRVASVPPTLEMATLPPSAEEVGRTEAALAERAAQVKAAGIACETYAAFGDPAEEVVRRASELRPRFIVVGTHGRTGLRHVLLGSVAERVVKHAPCPVLVVPTRDS